MVTNKACFVVLLTLVVSVACAERSSDPILPAMRPESSVAAQGRLPEFAVLARKRGQEQRYRMQLDTKSKSISLTSLTEPACYPDDPTCNGDPSTPACSLVDPACEYGEYPVSGTDSVYMENPPALSEAWYDAGPFICPEYVDNPEFTFRGRLFLLEDTRIYRIAFLPTNTGLPKARYRIPSGQWTSKDGTLRIFSGTLDGTCMVYETTYFGFLRVREGYMNWYKFQGVSEDLTFSGGGQAQDGIWVSYGGERGGSYMGPEAARVLERYLNDGVCTSGWMIFVNGAQVC
jgi:hypothetical protein